MNPTIKDVAKKSGISIATVSKYLNGKPVRERSARQIEQAIEVQDYHVNQTARGLRTTRSMLIGVVVDGLNTFSGDIISILSEELEPYGYCVLVREIKQDEKRFQANMDFFINKGVDGIVIVSSYITSTMLESYRGFNNIVIVDNAFNDTAYDFVVSDNLSASYHAVEQFIMKGHKNIAIITDTNLIATVKERLNGYQRCLRDYKLPIREEFILRGECNPQGGYSAFSQLATLLSRKDRPTAVLISSFYMSIGALMAARDLGVAIPDTLSIICFDNFDVNNVSNPRLVCLEQPVYEIGITTAKLLLRRLQGKADECSIVRLPVKIVPGDSVKALTP